jgi:predicted component of viral defense system (DUF524 family)
LTGILGIVLVSIALAGCRDVYTPPVTSNSNTIVNDGVTWLDSLTRLTANHTTDVETLEKMVSNILQTRSIFEGTARSVAEAPAITGVRKVTTIPPKFFTSGSGVARSAVVKNEEPVELYTFEVTDPIEETTGYILASNDNRIGNILAIVKDGEFDDPENLFINFLLWAISENRNCKPAAKSL